MSSEPAILLTLVAVLVQEPQSPFERAIARAYPEARIQRCSTTIDDARRQRIAELTGEPFEPGVVFSYVVRRDGRLLATVYFDRHRVRTKGELLMIAVTPKATIAGIEVVAFAEPKEYQPSPTWYAQFDGHGLDADLQLKHGIDGVSGATLTARATTDAARRTLALHQVLTTPPPAAKRK